MAIQILFCGTETQRKRGHMAMYDYRVLTSIRSVATPTHPVGVVRAHVNNTMSTDARIS